MLNRIGILGDVHAQIAPLETALEFLREAAVDRVLCTGDICDGPQQRFGDTRRCIEVLRRNEVGVVRGNHDRWFLDGQLRELPDITPFDSLGETELQFLRALPSTLAFDTPAGKLLLCHGLGANDMTKLTPDDFGYALEMNKELQQLLRSEYSLVIAGHTHQRMLRVIGGKIFINAGTFLPDKSPCFSVADFTKKEVQFFDVRSSEVVESAVLRW